MLNSVIRMPLFVWGWGRLILYTYASLLIDTEQQICASAVGTRSWWPGSKERGWLVIIISLPFGWWGLSVYMTNPNGLAIVVVVLFNFLLRYMCMWCVWAHTCHGPCGGRLQNTTLSTMRVLGIKLESSGFSCWTISVMFLTLCWLILIRN